MSDKVRPTDGNILGSASDRFATHACTPGFHAYREPSVKPRPSDKLPSPFLVPIL